MLYTVFCCLSFFFFFDGENIFIMFGAVGKGPVSELLELLLGAGSLGDLEDVEVHGLAQGPALAHRDAVANLDIPEAGRKVHGHVLVALLEAVVLSDVVKVVSVDDDGPLHLHFGHHARQDPPSNGDVTRKRAFLVNVSALDGLLWSLKAQTNVLVVSREFFFASFSKQDPLLILKDGRLLLVLTFCLNVSHLPGGLKKRKVLLIYFIQVVHIS